MHDPRLTYIYMRKDLMLQCMHKAAAQHRTPLISPISLQSKTKLGFNFVESLWYGSSWPRSQSERGKSNLEWKKNTFILSNYNELVDMFELRNGDVMYLIYPGISCSHLGNIGGIYQVYTTVFLDLVYTWYIAGISQRWAWGIYLVYT